MSTRPPALSRYTRATEPTSDAVSRVVNRVLERVDPPRLRPAPYRPGATGRPWTGSAVLAGLGALAIGVLVWRAVAPPETTARPLESPAGWSEAGLVPGVHARFHGSGHVQGGSSPSVTWRAGTLELAVDPQADLAVRVQTLEADVRVVGTLFTVQRDATGTTVHVSNGIVQVICSGEEPASIIGGQRLLCLPTHAAGMLGRARALEAAGAVSDQVLAAIQAGLSQAQGPVAGELRAFRIQHLLRTGEHARARAYIDAYLDLGTVLRRTQMLRAAARLAADDCAAVRRYLSLIPESARTSQDLEHAARCRAR